MFARPILLAIALAITGTPAEARQAAPTSSVKQSNADGVVRVRSSHGFDETVDRLKAAIAAKGVRFFDALDQQALGKEANLTIGKSVIVRFGNPPLGVQFLQANRYAGLDWPVRMLVVEEADGSVWLAWTDFAFMAKRYRITTQDAQFKMAAEVAGAIAADAAN
ncbi:MULTISPECIES: DUF302 domain-containing protein [unclassified Sphingomonas]|uniref:DUF302 domain-containing protein n=1 Tax=unclassified Sphingomonas TaxID=196159 RepID=UPI000BCE3DDF|nr:MAG: hypothetical protein B7Z43_09635 [Sphingomonas sp. 12-62-6]OYX38015.1 MAG: hypothetical protein B7Y98_10565 [Sphingomonas sp. 32-62-10]